MSFTLESGFSEAQGRRDTMEDAHVVFDDILAVENIGITSVPGSRVSFYGVYDGHGGVCAATFKAFFCFFRSSTTNSTNQKLTLQNLLSTQGRCR